MKKVLLSILLLTAVMFAGENVNAQQMKIGVFDMDYMVQAMPGYRNVDSLLDIYQRDSLTTEYDIYQNEYKRLDSTWKADSAANKPKAVLDYTGNQRQQIAMNLVYWQQISQKKLNEKRGVLAQPLYE